MPETQKKVMICIPAYTGQMHIETAQSLLAEIIALMMAGWEYEISIERGNCYIHRARNKLVAKFLQSNCTALMFIDTDVAWQPGEVVALLEKNADIAGCVYPFRRDPIEFPLRFLPKPELWADKENGMLEVEAFATGFMCIQRRVLEKMVDDFAANQYMEADTLDKVVALFECLRLEGTEFGEDYVFCLRARQSGFHLFINQDRDMIHIGYKGFMGNVGAALRARIPTTAVKPTNEGA